MAEAIKEYDLFSDVWRLFRKYYNISADQEYWNDLLREVHEIENKHNSKLCIDLLIAIVAELERKYTTREERGLSHEEESGNII
jgi:RNA:NAD 2'-phosphotransferase (TPT1/KptA family)